MRATSVTKLILLQDEAGDVATGPEVCIDHVMRADPLGLHDLSAEERELFSTSVNSPLKVANQAGQREAQHRDIPGARKMSFSQGLSSTNLSSPISTRPFGRRRDTNDSSPFPKETPASPVTSRFVRDETPSGPPNPLVRRRADLKDLPSDRESTEARETDEENIDIPFGLSRRISAGPLSAGLGGPPSPWSTSGMVGSGSSNGPNSGQKRPMGLNRSESRFKSLMSRDSTENIPGLGTLTEDEKRGSGQFGQDERAPSRDSSQLHGHSRLVGSAALGGANDDLPQSHLLADQGHGSFPKNSQDSYPDQPTSLTQPGQHSGEEPSSPTYTNPYQSPERNIPGLNDYDADDLDIKSLHLPGLGGMRNDPPLGGLSSSAGLRGSSAFEAQPFDRNAGFPAAPQRGFSGLGGLGSLPGVNSPGQWPTSLGSAAPAREHAFQGLGDIPMHGDGLHSQAFPGLGGLGSYGLENSNDVPRSMGTGRLGSLFPSDMQDQMRSNEGTSFQDRPRGGYDPFSSRPSETTHLVMSGLSRDIDSPFGLGRMNDSMSREEQLSNSPADAPVQQRYSPGPHGMQASFDQPQRRSSVDHEPSHSQSSQPPAAQQKTMVMPDRIRWIYRDPQGHTQGPWSGLEMHDWYRAGFFSPELLVKKVEDPDYEPLAQLIRRIGNSREPFLVPQIGIPGPPSASGAWPSQPTPSAAPSAATPAAQPPFASSFPSFGTTLTAEQQNALERRKQEEQYLMARQKEHLAQQQVLAKHRTVPAGPGAQGAPQGLQHHSSAHSLQSQPSYGSITGPSSGFQSSQVHSQNRAFPGAFESGPRGPAASSTSSGVESLGIAKAEDASRALGRLDPGHPGSTAFEGHRQVQEQPSLDELDEENERIASMLADRARLQQEQAEANKIARGESGDYNVNADRLRQFQHLQQEQQERLDYDHQVEAEVVSAGHELPAQDYFGQTIDSVKLAQPHEHKLTLTEQVQKAASAKQSPSSLNNSPWVNKMDKPITESHPSSQTSSPLPAPAARRSGRQSVADALAAESSKPASPAAGTPTASIAPWAKEPPDNSQKQPSLKEIQEAEAQRAAKREEEQAALRRAALERDLANQPAPPTPGLPSSSTWASGDGIMSPSSGPPSAWVKPVTKVTATPTGMRKTLQQIQKEEEALAKKQKAAAANAAAVHGNTSNAVSSVAQAVAAGKRYADLASRATASAPGAGSAWTTVGASGKAKTPVVPAGPVLQRTTTGSLVSNVAASAATPTINKKSSTGPSRPAASAITLTAYDEFKKWAVGELRSDLNKGVDGRSYRLFITRVRIS